MRNAAGLRRTILPDLGTLVDRDDADAAVVDADRAQRPQPDLDAAVEIERHAEREDQRRADHVAVADNDASGVAMALADLQKRLDRAELHRAHRLAAGNPRQAAVLAPGSPARVVADCIEGRAGPLAEIEFDQVVAEFDRQAQPLGNDLRAFAGALQWAGVEPGDGLARQPIAGGRDLRPAAFGQPDPGG